ncbi:hypothetical protein PHYPO_G00068150 [Pangasianodon hypophthalmus]|uniref:Uncharacterized protein n=1 Tax=Pangasianodon hypophthalmus TaxID=310915 RepID=A0A5N5LVD3_PANHP|nr:hypothetical protein PHYPO_G00068150 [Pangasianodon hypophthalmus]
MSRSGSEIVCPLVECGQPYIPHLSVTIRNSPPIVSPAWSGYFWCGGHWAQIKEESERLLLWQLQGEPVIVPQPFSLSSCFLLEYLILDCHLCSLLPAPAASLV